MLFGLARPRRSAAIPPSPSINIADHSNISPIHLVLLHLIDRHIQNPTLSYHTDTYQQHNHSRRNDNAEPDAQTTETF
jgi:hypothetical protein